MPTAAAPTAYQHKEKDHSTTHSAVEEGVIIIRDKDKQQQDINTLSRDTQSANNELAPIFDKQKELDKIEKIELVADIASQAKDMAQKYSRMQAEEKYKSAQEKYNALTPEEKALADKAIEEDLKKHGIDLSKYAEKDRPAVIRDEYIRQTVQREGIGNMGDGFSKGIDAATSIVIGIIKGDITGGLAGASAPYLATLIKEQTGESKAANLVAHAILGAVVAELQGNSGLSGGIGAVTGEVTAEFMAKHIYGKDVKDLTEAEKRNISSLSQLASGLAVASVGGNTGDIAAAIASSKNAVENNRMLTKVERDRINKLAGENIDEKRKYWAAACALVKCSAEYSDDDPLKKFYEDLEKIGNGDDLQSYREILKQQTNILKRMTQQNPSGGWPTYYDEILNLFDYTTTDKYSDSIKKLNNDYSLMIRGGGVVKLGISGLSGLTGLGLSLTCETGIGCFLAGGALWYAIDTGATGINEIIDGKKHIPITAKWLANAFDIDESTAELLFDITGGVATLKSTASLVNNSVVNTGKLSTQELQKIVDRALIENAKIFEAQAQEALLKEISQFTSASQAAKNATMVGAYDPLTGRIAIGSSNANISAEMLHPSTIKYLEQQLGVKIGEFTKLCNNKVGACAEISAADKLIRQGVAPERIRFGNPVRPRTVYEQSKITEDSIIKPCNNCQVTWPKDK